MTAARLVSFNRETLGVVAKRASYIDWLIERRALSAHRENIICISAALLAGNQLPHSARGRIDWREKWQLQVLLCVYLPREQRAGLIKNVGILINVYKHQQVNLIEASFKAL